MNLAIKPPPLSIEGKRELADLDWVQRLFYWQEEEGHSFWAERDQGLFMQAKGFNKKYANRQASHLRWGYYTVIFPLPDKQGHFSVTEARLSFILHNGRWANGRVRYLDGDKTNARPDNLIEQFPPKLFADPAWVKPLSASEALAELDKER
jgi:hypothetical protein